MDTPGNFVSNSKLKFNIKIKENYSIFKFGILNV